MIRAKFQVEFVTDYGNGNCAIHLKAICDSVTEENARFTKYTPSGTMDFTITNPLVTAQMKPGKIFYLDFTEAAN